MEKWQVRGMLPHGEYGGLAGGPEGSFPTESQRKSMREAGLKIYVDGKLYKEPDSKSKATRTKKK